MRYLGGKTRIAKEIAAVVAPRGYWWEPFCGGLSVSVQLAKYGRGLVSDVHPALMSLYRGVRDGWDPPGEVSREDYERAKLLPDSDPFKAFAGFFCSFNGCYFHGFDAGGRRWVNSRTRGRAGEWVTSFPARAAREALLEASEALVGHALVRMDFFAVRPGRGRFESIYIDPPYDGTTGYGIVFDHQAFWGRCIEWARFARVFVSEYACPVAHEQVWEKPHRIRAWNANGERELRTERLFLVKPVSKLTRQVSFPFMTGAA